MTTKTGWYNKNRTGNTVKQEAHRHSLASRGIKTTRPKGVKGVSFSGSPTPNFDMVKKGQVGYMKLYGVEYYPADMNPLDEDATSTYEIFKTKKEAEDFAKGVQLRFVFKADFDKNAVYEENGVLNYDDYAGSMKNQEIISKNKKTDMVSKGKNGVTRENLVDYIMDYEEGKLSKGDTLKLFSHLFKTGLLGSLQGHYGRNARRFIEAGYISADGKILKTNMVSMDMRIAGWKKTTDLSWYHPKSKKAFIIEHGRGYHKYFGEKGYLGEVGIGLGAMKTLYSKPKTKKESIKYAIDYMKKHPKG